MSEPASIVARLMAVIEARKVHRPSGSYTAELLEGGVNRIAAKVIEEAGEVAEAVRKAESAERRGAVVHEAADVIYHLLVLLAACEVSLAEVETELVRRFGVSGIEEKAAPHCARATAEVPQSRWTLICSGFGEEGCGRPSQASRDFAHRIDPRRHVPTTGSSESNNSA